MKTKQEEVGDEELGEVDVVEEDKPSTKPRLNATNVIHLGIFQTSVLVGRRVPIMPSGMKRKSFY